jgi:hypothetical protein
MKDERLFLSSYSSKPTDAAIAAADDDERWFARHRRRVHRIRKVWEDEFPNKEGTHALVTKLREGVISRTNFASHGEDLPNTDLQGECIWQRWGNPPLSEKYGLQVFMMNVEAEGSA